MAVPEPTAEDLRTLSAELTRAAGHGTIRVPDADREDVAQEALIRLVTETPRPSAPPLIVRGFAALRLAKVDYVRTKSRAKEPDLTVVENVDQLSRDDAAIRLFELRELVEQVGGPDALELAEARVVGETEAEVGARPGWTRQRAHAGRRQLKRVADEIRREMLDA